MRGHRVGRQEDRRGLAVDRSCLSILLARQPVAAASTHHLHLLRRRPSGRHNRMVDLCQGPATTGAEESLTRS